MTTPTHESLAPLPSYSGLWRAGISFVPVRNGRRSDKSGPPGFRSTPTLGGITAETGSLAWHMDLGIPASFAQNEIRLLNCGFLLSNRNQELALILQVEPGVFVGDLPAAFTPELFTANRILHEEENRAWLEAGGLCVLLMQTSNGERRRFALVVGANELDILLQVARHHLQNTEIPAAWLEAWQERLAWMKLLPESERSDRLDYALECLDAVVEQPGTTFANTWLRDAREKNPVQDIHSLAFVLPALARFQPARCQALLQGLVDLAQAGTALPLKISADGRTSTTPAWPILAQGVELARAESKDFPLPPGLCDVLRDHLAAYLTAWDPEKERVPVWPDEEHCLTPEIFDPDLDLVDLPSLLLTEIEAYVRISGDTQRFAGDHQRLLERLRREFWSPERGVFLDRMRDGNQVKRMTAGSLLPLLWEDSRDAAKKSMFQSVRSPGGLRGEHGLLQWEFWESDAIPVPVRPELQHLLLLPLLRQAPHEVASLAGSAWARAFDSFADRQLGFPQDWSAATSGNRGRQWEILTAAFWIRISPLMDQIDLELSRYPAGVRFLERYRKGLVGLVSGIIIAIPLTLGIYYAKLDTLSMRQQYTEAGYAETLYSLQMYQDADSKYTRLLDQLPKGRRQAQYYFMRGKSRYHLGLWAEALEDFQTAVQLDTRGALPAAHWNLAQLQWRQGDTAAAVETLDELRIQYRDLYPALQGRIEDAIAILKTNPQPELPHRQP